MLRLITALALVALAPAARANIFDVYGMGARGIAMGGAQTSTVDDYSATFYNPAALARVKKIVFGGGFVFTQPQLTIRRASSESDIEAVIPDAFSGFHLGWVFPFGGALEDKLAAGVAFYVPTINLVRAQALDPQTPQFYMYQNLPDQLMILLSLAYEPVEWLSFGLGVQVLADVFGEAAFEVDIVNGTFERSNLTVELLPSAAATAGLHLGPFEGLRLGLAWRQEHALEFGLPAAIAADQTVALGLTVGGTVLYTPHTINLGASYRVESIGLTASVEVDYQLWSRAPDPSPAVGIDVGGGVLEAFGLGSALDIGTDQPPIDLGFRDTLTPRIGLEWEAAEWTRLWAGYFYRPTPAPRSTGPFNYLDNDVHAFSLGAAFTFNDPFTDETRPISVQLGSSLGWLPRRTIVKENRDDPVGDLEHGGLTLSLNVTVNHSF